jgi:potassium-transporting ATPase KdpC subunit
MKSTILASVKLTAICLVFLSVVYPALIWAVAQVSPNQGKGFVVNDEPSPNKGSRYYYTNIAQSFTEDKYFWSRPSAVGYNAAGSAGSNKGPSNAEYLKQVSERIDTFMVHHPYLSRKEVPAEMVTASGSGLDPDISVQLANVQVKRIATARHLEEKKVQELVRLQTQKPLLGIFGPSKINVLQLNMALDQIK